MGDEPGAVVGVGELWGELFGLLMRPVVSGQQLRDYAAAWIDERPGLRPNTVQVYQYVLGKHLLPAFGNRLVADIREAPHVRRLATRPAQCGNQHIFGRQGLPPAQSDHDYGRQ